MTLQSHAPAFTERSLRWREYSTEQPKHGEIALVRINAAGAQFEAVHVRFRDGSAWVLPSSKTAFLCQPTDAWRPESDR